MAEVDQALHRFVVAQDRVLPQVLGELEAGAKRSHWMWFVFPQIAGLGLSEMARTYAIADLEEARRYLGHATLGPRLKRCTHLVNAVTGRSAHDIFGSPDDKKFWSSMTLFAAAAPGERLFADALQTYFAGEPDKATLQIVARQSNG